MDGAPLELARWIVATALECGADLAGVAGAGDLKASPSHRIHPLLQPYSGVGTRDAEGREPGRVDWPEDAVSVVVVAVRHSEAEPGLDWWRDGFSGGTQGNRRLMDVNAALTRRLADERGVIARSLPYHIERGGIFLKDAAALAGIGVVGRNNLVVTPEYGPRVRLRCLTIDREAAPTGPSEFDPCVGCAAPCREVCPRGALAVRVHDPDRYGIARLPGRDGAYDRIACNGQMEEDAADHATAPRADTGEPGRVVMYCRRCEFACWVGEGV